MKETNNLTAEQKAIIFNYISNLIIEKAIRDYIFALNGLHTGLTRYTSLAKDCENFFTSQWYEFLTHKYDGRKLIKRIQKLVKEQKKENNQEIGG